MDKSQFARFSYTPRTAVFIVLYWKLSADQLENGTADWQLRIAESSSGAPSSGHSRHPGRLPHATSKLPISFRKQIYLCAVR